jgi:hypothetical protein
MGMHIILSRACKIGTQYLAPLLKPAAGAARLGRSALYALWPKNLMGVDTIISISISIR